MNDTDLLIIGSLDQPIKVDTDWILKRVDEIIEEAVARKNVNIAINACATLIQASQLSGLALAKFFYSIQRRWSEFESSSTFEEEMYPRLGAHPTTIDRYIQVWKVFAEKEIPFEYHERLQQRNIKDLIPIAKALEQGYEVSDEQWEDLSTAPDFNTVAKVIREDIKGKPPRKGALSITEDKIGSLWAWKDNNRYFVGSLEVDSDEDAVQQAIERIRKGSGMMKS
jgi:hypothetical protein